MFLTSPPACQQQRNIVIIAFLKPTKITISETTVANTKSAIKRIQIAERNRLRNKAYKSAVKTLMKKCLQVADDYSRNPSSDGIAAIQQSLSAAYSKIDKAVKRRVLHRNNGARKKARLASAIAKATAAS